MGRPKKLTDQHVGMVIHLTKTVRNKLIKKNKKDGGHKLKPFVEQIIIDKANEYI